MTHQIDWRSMFKDVLSRMRNAGESNEMGARWMSTAANEAVAAALATKDADIEKLKAALERIASSEAMTTSFYRRDNDEGKELLARMLFAEDALKGDAQ